MKRISFIKVLALAGICMTLFFSCGAAKEKTSDTISLQPGADENAKSSFSPDSAYHYVETQVGFCPRVPGTEAHKLCGDWLAAKLKSFGTDVTEQTASLITFDGTRIPMRNIFARVNPNTENRILLLAHWDCRPWADHDPDPAKRNNPVDGANDGASGTAVILELARVLSQESNGVGFDILFCDAEDWGEESNDDSWALGARYFVENPISDGYMPSAAILLDMVGAQDATFMREYYSQLSNPALADRIWAIASSLGYDKLFVNKMGSAINDDHVELIKGGIPAIDIIDYRDGSGFYDGWHTSSDNLDAISKETLGAVGNVLENYILTFNN